MTAPRKPNPGTRKPAPCQTCRHAKSSHECVKASVEAPVCISCPRLADGALVVHEYTPRRRRTPQASSPGAAKAPEMSTKVDEKEQ